MMRYLIIGMVVCICFSCKRGVYIKDYTPTYCDNTYGEKFYDLKNRITHQYYQDGSLYLGFAFTDNCANNLTPKIEMTNDTLIIYSHDAAKDSFIVLCDCYFGLDIVIGGFNEVRADSLVILLDRCTESTIEPIYSESEFHEYDAVDFAIIFGDTLFYTEPENVQEGDIPIRDYRAKSVVSSFENDYRLRYVSVSDSLHIEIDNSNYEKKYWKKDFSVFGNAKYSDEIILGNGLKGFEVTLEETHKKYLKDK